MNKLQVTKAQVATIEAGATMLMIPIDRTVHSIDMTDGLKSARNFKCLECENSRARREPCSDCYNKGYVYDLDCESENEFIGKYAPVQIGDKNVFIQEDFHLKGIEKDIIIYRHGISDNYTNKWLPASEMTKEQSRFTVDEVIDIKVVKVHEAIHDYSTILESLSIGSIKKFGLKYHVPKSYMGHEQNAKQAFIEFYNAQLKEQNINRTYDDNDYVILLEANKIIHTNQ